MTPARHRQCIGIPLPPTAANLCRPFPQRLWTPILWSLPRGGALVSSGPDHGSGVRSTKIGEDHAISPSFSGSSRL